MSNSRSDELVSYYVTDPDGVVVRAGTCPRHLLEMSTAGYGQVHLGHCPPGRFRLVGDVLEPLAPHYVEARRQEYPAIGDQLDAIWRVLDQLPSLPAEADQMLRDIRDVKARHPKR